MCQYTLFIGAEEFMSLLFKNSTRQTTNHVIIVQIYMSVNQLLTEASNSQKPTNTNGDTYDMQAHTIMSCYIQSNAIKVKIR